MVYKKTVAKNVNRTSNKVQAPKKTQAPRNRTVPPTNSIAAAKKAMVAAQRALNSQKPVVIQRTRTISTNGTWFNAIEIETNPAWVAPRPGESYVWGQRDPSGPAAVVAKRFTILRGLRDLESATLFLSVDNYAIVLINGRAVVNDIPQADVSFFNPGRTFDIRDFLRRGVNDIVIAAFNSPSNDNRTDINPAGVLARITLEFD